MLYLSFRTKAIKEAKSLRSLAEDFVSKDVNMDQDEIGFNVTGVYQSYVLINMTNSYHVRKAHQKVAEKWIKDKRVLAVEFLDRKKLFGISASLDEMSKFKSKVRKQEVQYAKPKPQKQEEPVKLKRPEGNVKIDPKIEHMFENEDKDEG